MLDVDVKYNSKKQTLGEGEHGVKWIWNRAVKSKQML